MDRNKNPIIMERYCPKVDANVVIMKNIVKNDGSYKCISHTECQDRESCHTFIAGTKDTARDKQTG